MVAAHPAILPAPLYYCNLKRARPKALQSGLTYDSNIAVDRQMSADLEWWATQCSQHNGWSLHIPHWDFLMASNASTQGWGANCEGVTTGGPWTPVEKSHHINYLELLAAFLALKSIAPNLHVVSILFHLDNITAKHSPTEWEEPTLRSCRNSHWRFGNGV